MLKVDIFKRNCHFEKNEESRPPLFERGSTFFTSTFSPLMGFRGKIAVLRHLEGFLEKSEELL